MGACWAAAVGPTQVELVRRPPALAARERRFDRIWRRVVNAIRTVDRRRVPGSVDGADQEVLAIRKGPVRNARLAEAGEGHGLLGEWDCRQTRECLAARDRALENAHPGVVGAHHELLSPHPLPFRQRATHTQIRNPRVVQQHLHPAAMERGSGRAARRPAHDQLPELGWFPAGAFQPPMLDPMSSALIEHCSAGPDAEQVAVGGVGRHSRVPSAVGARVPAAPFQRRDRGAGRGVEVVGGPGERRVGRADQAGCHSPLPV